MSGVPPHVRKRFSQNLTRQWVQKYRQSTGIQISPKKEYSSASSAHHDDPKPEQIKIIIAPPSKTAFGEVDRHDRTKKIGANQ